MIGQPGFQSVVKTARSTKSDRILTGAWHWHLLRVGSRRQPRPSPSKPFLRAGNPAKALEATQRPGRDCFRSRIKRVLAGHRVSAGEVQRYDRGRLRAGGLGEDPTDYGIYEVALRERETAGPTDARRQATVAPTQAQLSHIHPGERQQTLHSPQGRAAIRTHGLQRTQYAGFLLYYLVVLPPRPAAQAARAAP
ncbi:hypothetical protein GQ53DRAFT_514788 [Thozetella sp. PMI_491]|nr:hypothetical protein GQ53DRAFT_514788 [Thozetella sp. PMI_491]